MMWTRLSRHGLWLSLHDPVSRLAMCTSWVCVPWFQSDTQHDAAIEGANPWCKPGDRRSATASASGAARPEQPAMQFMSSGQHTPHGLRGGWSSSTRPLCVTKLCDRCADVCFSGPRKAAAFLQSRWDNQGLEVTDRWVGYSTCLPVLQITFKARLSFPSCCEN